MGVRYIPERTKVILWGLTAGRCQYDGCNVKLFEDPLTRSIFNQSYIAHIIADTPGGPRGDAILSEKLKADISNLMLLCDTHHRLIDKEDVAGHPVERLQEMKRHHEERVQLLAAIDNEKRTNVVLFGSNIGKHDSSLNLNCAQEGIVPFRFPAEARCIELSLQNSASEDHSPEYWKIERANLETLFERKITHLRAARSIKHYSIFGLAAQPLLVLLGALFGDIYPADVYQLKKEPQSTWAWLEDDLTNVIYRINRPKERMDRVALKFSLSASISNERVNKVLGADCSIWELTVDDPNNDLIRKKEHLSDYRKVVRGLLDEIKLLHGEDTELHVFPAMPVSTAIELGRVWNPKSQLPLVLYDQNRKTRAANPWSDIPLAEVLILAGANCAETFPILNKYLWQQRDNGGRWIVIDPRETGTARQGDLHLQLKPGTDVAVANGMLNVIVREGLMDEKFISDHTNGWEETRVAIENCTPDIASQISGVPAEKIIQAGLLYGRAKTGMIMHARGIEHHSNGVDNVLSYINIVLATGKIGDPGRGYGTITGQGNGQGGREHGQKAEQLPGMRSIYDAADRKFICDFWGLPEDELPDGGVSAVEMFDKMRSGEIKALFSICNNGMVSLPDINSVRRSLEGLEFNVCVDFFMSESSRYADVVLPGTTWAEDEGVTASAEARVVKINKAVDPPGEAKEDWWIASEIARRMGRGEYFKFDSPREIFDELRGASRGGKADYYGITYEKIDRQNGVMWPCPTEESTGTPRMFNDKKFYLPDGKARFHPTEYKGADEKPDDEYPLILTSGRVVYQYLSGNQTRRIGFLVQQCPEPYVEIHPETAQKLQINDGERVKVISRRGEGVFPALVVRTIRPDTIFIPYHWGEQLAVNQLTNPKLDPTSKIPEFKACAAKIEKVHSRELPILGKGRKGASLSEVQKGN